MSTRQYYWLGIQINEADHLRMTSNSTSYEIVTEFGWADLLISASLGLAGFSTRTVTVYR